MNLKIKEDKLKNRVSKVRSIFLSLLFFTYMATSFLYLENCSTKKEDISTAERISKSKTEKVKLLQNEFNAEVFDCTVKDIFNSSIVLDTTLLGISKKDGNIYLSAKVNGACAEKYYVKLRCSKEIAEIFNKAKTNDAIIAAKIFRVDSEKLVANADSLYGADPTINLGETIVLSGECLAIKELDIENNAD